MDKFALITGAARRIGKALALKLADKGYNIFLHYRSSEDEAKATQKLIRKKNRRCILKQADFAQEQEVAALIEDCMKEESIEILINSASMFVKSTFQTESYELLDDLFKSNFKAPYILTKRFARQGNSGLIINMLDTKVNKLAPAYLDYWLTKKCLEALTHISAVELGPNIRVNGIAPGVILPPEDESEDYVQELAEELPLKKSGAVNNLEQALEFFMQNSFVTGEIINVDGGEHLG